jgi:hypothetical protein
MPLAEFEPSIPANERPQTHDLDLSAIVLPPLEAVKCSLHKHGAWIILSSILIQASESSDMSEIIEQTAWRHISGDSNVQS